MTSSAKSDSPLPAPKGPNPWGPQAVKAFPGKTGEQDFPYTERYLQCVWFDEELRPRALKTEQGDEIVVEHPGQWNLEDGPDFRSAVLRVGPDGRRLTGDVEIHVHAADWQRHGHAGNPAYERVIAHVTYFPGVVPASGLPRGALQLSLKDALAENPFFSFESLDLSAYPYALRQSATPCARVLKTWDSAQVAQLLETAGEERLRVKTERMTSAIATQGFDQTLYEEVMTALGYKNNRAPFRYLARQLPLKTLRLSSGNDPLKAYALLMGVSGLLPRQTPGRWDAETRAFVRQLWDHWWKFQADWSPKALPRSAWKLSGLRPQNHPQRRLMLAAILFADEPGLEQRLQALTSASPEHTLQSMTALFNPEENSYWQRRLAFAGKPQAAPIALMGEGRIAALISNVLIPLLAASGNRSVISPAFLRHLKPEEDNQILRQTANNLLSPDHNPALYRSGLRQQGLIQIFHDFCLTDRSRCGTCALLKLLEKERG